MTYSYRATSAVELRSIPSQHPNPGNNDNIHIGVALYQPLLNPAVLSASRDPTNRFTDQTGHVEMFNTTHLNRDWRSAWVEVLKYLTDADLSITFDPALPQFWSEDASEEEFG